MKKGSQDGDGRKPAPPPINKPAPPPGNKPRYSKEPKSSAAPPPLPPLAKKVSTVILSRKTFHCLWSLPKSCFALHVLQGSPLRCKQVTLLFSVECLSLGRQVLVFPQEHLMNTDIVILRQCRPYLKCLSLRVSYPYPIIGIRLVSDKSRYKPLTHTLAKFGQDWVCH